MCIRDSLVSARLVCARWVAADDSFRRRKTRLSARQNGRQLTTAFGATDDSFRRRKTRLSPKAPFVCRKLGLAEL
eukprot:11342908-Alexandrium_andersonii.AAC.1